MAPQKRTRQQAGPDLSSENLPLPAKRIKTSTNLDFNTWEPPPEFWERLSKIELTRGALREFDRLTKPSRTGLKRSRHSLAHTTRTPRLTRSVARALTQFAQEGGPDLSHLRGYPYLPKPDPVTAVMSSQSGCSRSNNPASTQPTSVTTKSKKTTVYSRNFDQHLTDHAIYATYSSEKPGLQDINKCLEVPRPSLSPSQFSIGAFERFQEASARAKDEEDVLANVMPTILGPDQASHPSARNTLFGNLQSLTDATIAPAKPDLYYGARPENLHRPIRNELERFIIPSSMHDKPIIPNFFVEVKGPDGSAAVVTRQARYDGAVGSRAMHQLQNYSREQPQYDEQAYTFSSTYHDGHLKLYAHHPTKTDEGPPEYHMTQIKAYAITNDRDTFVEGTTAFRSLRDLAGQYRHRFILAANSRASQQATVAPEVNPTVVQLDLGQEESADEFVDCQDYSPPRTPDQAAPRATDLNDDSQGSALPDLGDMSTSFASSFRSDFTTDRSKRPRQPLSPDSKATTRSPPSKSRHIQRTGGVNQRSPLTCLHEDGAEHLWVETYLHEGCICFRVEKEETRTNRKEWTLQTQQDGSFCFRWNDSRSQTVWTKELASGSSTKQSVLLDKELK